MYFIRDQSGFSVIETLLGIVLMVVMLNAVLNVMFTAGRGVDNNNSKISVFRDIENSAPVIADDVAMTQTTDLVDGAAAVTSVTLQWFDYASGGAQHQSSYVRSGTNLQRTYDGVTQTVAKYIKSVTFARSGQGITVMLTSCNTEGSTVFTVDKSFTFYMRPQNAVTSTPTRTATPTPTQTSTPTATPTGTPVPTSC